AFAGSSNNCALYPDTDLTEDAIHHYVPSLACLCIRQLTSYPDQVSGVALNYAPPQDNTEFDILKALIPSYTEDSFNLSVVDPCLWAVLVQIYGLSLPKIFHTYPIALADTHLPLLQSISSTPTFSLITILELPGCPQLTDDTLTTIKSLHALAAFDASETLISSWGLKKLMMPALIISDAEDIKSLSKSGPLGLRILRLRNCKAIDHTIFTSLQKLLFLSVIDLRGTNCDPSAIPSPYSQWSSADLEESMRRSLYHPTPLTESISSLQKLTTTLASATTTFQIHVDSVKGRSAHLTKVNSFMGKYQTFPAAAAVEKDFAYRKRHPPRTPTTVGIQDEAFTFTSNAIVSHPPQPPDVNQSGNAEQLPGYMHSVAERESRQLAKVRKIRNFYASATGLFSLSAVTKQRYSAEKYYAEYAMREQRRERSSLRSSSRRAIWSEFDNSDRSKKKRRLTDKETTTTQSPSEPFLLMLYRTPPPWHHAEPLPPTAMHHQKSNRPQTSRPADVTNAATVNRSRVKLQMVADLQFSVGTAARNRRLGDPMANFDGVKSSYDESTRLRSKDAMTTVQPILQGKNPFRRSNTEATVQSTLSEGCSTDPVLVDSSSKEGREQTHTLSIATAQSKQKPPTYPRPFLKPISSVRVPELPPEEMRKLKESMVKQPPSDFISRKSLPIGTDIRRPTADALSSRKRNPDGNSKMMQLPKDGKSFRSGMGTNAERKMVFDWKSWGST
ncbi:hypothetical protein HHX47_DHR1000822, partial [Lentinula edodes]